jgi:hypothetical protein
MDEPMAYVAEDPQHPGTAWACCVDRPECRKDTAKIVAEWIEEGARIKRVDIDTARAMLGDWVKLQGAC